MSATVHPSFSHSVRVYWEDTDAGGVVYYANYLKFCERARTEWLRTTGLVQNRLATEQNILFVVRSVAADYLRPAVLDDLLEAGPRLLLHARSGLRSGGAVGSCVLLVEDRLHAQQRADRLRLHVLRHLLLVLFEAKLTQLRSALVAKVSVQHAQLVPVGAAHVRLQQGQ